MPIAHVQNRQLNCAGLSGLLCVPSFWTWLNFCHSPFPHYLLDSQQLPSYLMREVRSDVTPSSSLVPCKSSLLNLVQHPPFHFRVLVEMLLFLLLFRYCLTLSSKSCTFLSEVVSLS